MPAPRQILVLAAAALTLFVAGCGDSGDGLLTSEQATSLNEKVDAAQQALDNDACEYAQKVAVEGAERASKQTDIDMALQTNIVEGFNQLAQQAESACTEEEPEEEKPEKTPTPEPTPTEEPTEEPTVEVTPEPEVTEVPTEAPTAEPTVTVPPLPTEDSGGAVAPETPDVPEVEEFDDG